MSRRRGQRGSIAPAVPIIAMSLLLLGGLVVDASRQLNARGQATAFAEEAARAGAQGVDLAQEGLVLDEVTVRDRVRSYCDRVETLGQVEDCRLLGIEPVSGDDPRRIVVRTRVATRIETTLLGMVGVGELAASAEARARPYEGVEEALP